MKQTKNMDWFRGVILFICLGIIPFIVKVQEVKTRVSEYGTVRSAEAVADAFSYYKMTFLIILAVALFIYNLMDIGSVDVKSALKRPVNFLPLAFVLLAFVSAVFSKYKDVAFNGATERYEGFWMLAAYMLFFTASAVYASEKDRLYVLLAGVSFGALLVGGFGALQYFGVNPYDIGFIKKIVMGERKFSLRFTSVFSTLYNPNCVGIYTGMLCPFFLISGLFAPLKKWYKYVFLGIFVLLLINLFGCESVGGFLGMAAGLALSFAAGLAYAVKKGSKRAKAVSGVVALCIIGGTAAVLAGNSKIKQKLDIIKQSLSDSSVIENPYFFEDLSIEDDTAMIKTKTGTILIPVKDGKWEVKFKALDSENAETVQIKEITAERGYTHSYTGDIPGIVKTTINTTDEGFLSFNGSDGQNSGTTFYFDISGGGIEASDMFGNIADLNKQYRRMGFEGAERLGSNRGYIWSRSIPLIADNILIGAGPDCFVFEFPQQDIRGKLVYLGNPNVVIDKPHNFYLQAAINTGLVSLAVLLVLFVLYFADTIKSLFKNKTDNFGFGIRLGIMAAVMGYLTAVATTDSVVSVSPVFWILLGMGFGVNKTEN